MNMARPAKLTGETQDRIVLALKAGNFLTTAARAAGVSEATVHRWLKAPGARYRAFASAVERAIAEAEVVAVATIAQSAPRNPGVALKLLERRRPNRWGRNRGEGSTVDEPMNVDQDDGQRRARYVNELTVPPEWAFVLNKLLTAAALGHSPEEFFNGSDRFAGLREDALPPVPWWRQSGITVEPASPMEGAIGEDPLTPSRVATP
jgi:hypothetical protein